jgi:hypothetical protein
MMYARVARWEGAEPEAIRTAAQGISADAASGPPEGLPAKGLMLLVDPDGGRALGITLFATEEDLRQGDATLNEMSPPGDGMGQRTAVETYEVAADLRM